MDIHLPIKAPINNGLQTTVYDKLDQMAYERIRVANTNLSSRLTVQEKILKKYRDEATRIHNVQTKQLQREARKIRQKRTAYFSDEAFFNKCSETKASNPTRKQRCLSEPPKNLSYCRRFYAHHYDLKDNTKKQQIERVEKKEHRDFCNVAMRLFYINMMININKRRQLEKSTPKSGEETGSLAEVSHITETLTDLNCGTKVPIENDSQGIAPNNDQTIFKENDSRLPNISSSLQSGYEEDPLDDITEAKDLCTEVHLELTPRDKRQKARRGSVIRPISKVSDIDIRNYGHDLRQSRIDFEKLFDGLL